MTRHFQDLETFTADDIEAAIVRNDPGELPLVPVTVALISPHLPTAEDACMRLALHADPCVRANAVMALGHLARRFRALDRDRVQPLLENALRDADLSVRRLAQVAADEVHQFLHWTISGHVFGSTLRGEDHLADSPAVCHNDPVSERETGK